MTRSLRLAAIAVATLIPAGAAAQVVAMGTNGQGTWTYSAGAAIAKAADAGGMQMRVQPYAGSTTLVPLINSGELDFGLANHLEALQAVKGEDSHDGRKSADLRVVGVLAPLHVVVFARADSDIRTMKDFKGKRLPTEYQAQRIIGVMLNGELANGGLGYGDVQGVPVPNIQRGADEFAAGRADGFHFALGAGKVMEVNAKVPLRAVSLDPSPEAVAAMRKFVPVAYVARIEPSPANVGVVEPTNVMAYDYLTLTNAKVPDAVVYALAKAMHGGGATMKATFPPLAGFAQDKMAKDLGEVSYHPGALKFYSEQGLWPPKS